jgi:hypothetical protein
MPLHYVMVICLGIRVIVLSGLYVRNIIKNRLPLLIGEDQDFINLILCNIKLTASVV